MSVCAAFTLWGLLAGRAVNAQLVERHATIDGRSGKVSIPADLPLSFEPNRGQTGVGVQFVARGPGYTLYLNDQGPSFQFSPSLDMSAVRNRPSLVLKLAGRNHMHSGLQGLDEQTSKSSYFLGSDPKKWLTGIPNFRKVGRREVYDGIDIAYRGAQGELACEFRIAPHARPETIELEILGADSLRADSHGDLIFKVANVEMRLQKPDAYQKVNGSNRAVASRYLVRKNHVSFRLGNYDSGRALFISPVLRYSDYLKLQESNFVPAT
jgi:hypothetical protein